MEKIFGIIKKALLSEMLNRIILDVCIVALLVLSILVLFIPVNILGEDNCDWILGVNHDDYSIFKDTKYPNGNEV